MIVSQLIPMASYPDISNSITIFRKKCVRNKEWDGDFDQSSLVPFVHITLDNFQQ